MIDQKLLNAVLGIVIGAGLVACGGGGSGGTAGIDGTGSPVVPVPVVAVVAVGTVTSFGSVFVNGVHFDTTGTVFTIDGESGSQSDLSVGDVVLVKGEFDDSSSTEGSADSIEFDDNVEGPVEIGSIDLINGTLVVLGQTVRITADTSFDDSIQPRSLEGLSDGDIVEVSGFVATDGSITSTRIELKLAGGEFEITGVVANLDDVNSRFNINALLVDYSAAAIDDFPSGSISEGDLVEVKGMDFDAGELLATRVEFKGGILDGDDGDHVEIEGFITRFVDETDFDVSGLPVTTNGQTVFEGGTATDLGLDIKVEAEGELDASGILVADKIDIRRSKAVRVMAVVDLVDAGAGSFEVLGITVKVDALTRLEDKSSADLEPFALGDLNVGDYVEVRGTEFPADSGDILAAILEREDLDTETELQGFVQSVSDPSVTILGVTITTSGSTAFEDETETPIDAGTFFSRVQAGSLVKTRGIEVSGPAINADEVEFENQ